MVAFTDNAVTMAAPIDLVWSMTNDVPSWPSLFTEYAAAEVLSTDGATSRIRLRTHPDEQGRTWSWTSDRTADHENYSVRASRVETGPFEFMNLQWTFREVADGVEMRWRQEFTMKKDAPFTDQQMKDHLNKNTKIQMNAIKSVVEQSARIRRNGDPQ